jgi:hydrogenase small subunit
LWITAGLSCDGDSVSITAATQPSLEDIVLGAIPALPKVILHHPILAYETGEPFLEAFSIRARSPSKRIRSIPTRCSPSSKHLGEISLFCASSVASPNRSAAKTTR